MYGGKLAVDNGCTMACKGTHRSPYCCSGSCLTYFKAMQVSSAADVIGIYGASTLALYPQLTICRLTVYDTTMPPGPLAPYEITGTNGYWSMGCYMYVLVQCPFRCIAGLLSILGDLIAFRLGPVLHPCALPAKDLRRAKTLGGKSIKVATEYCPIKRRENYCSLRLL
jgi:hypothetical protein